MQFVRYVTHHVDLQTGQSSMHTKSGGMVGRTNVCVIMRGVVKSLRVYLASKTTYSSMRIIKKMAMRGMQTEVHF